MVISVKPACPGDKRKETEIKKLERHDKKWEVGRELLGVYP